MTSTRVAYGGFALISVLTFIYARHSAPAHASLLSIFWPGLRGHLLPVISFQEGIVRFLEYNQVIGMGSGFFWLALRFREITIWNFPPLVGEGYWCTGDNDVHLWSWNRICSWLGPEKRAHTQISNFPVIMPGVTIYLNFGVYLGVSYLLFRATPFSLPIQDQLLSPSTSRERKSPDGFCTPDFSVAMRSGYPMTGRSRATMSRALTPDTTKRYRSIIPTAW